MNNLTPQAAQKGRAASTGWCLEAHSHIGFQSTRNLWSFFQLECPIPSPIWEAQHTHFSTCYKDVSIVNTLQPCSGYTAWSNCGRYYLTDNIWLVCLSSSLWRHFHHLFYSRCLLSLEAIWDGKDPKSWLAWTIFTVRLLQCWHDLKWIRHLQNLGLVLSPPRPLDPFQSALCCYSETQSLLKFTQLPLHCDILVGKAPVCSLPSISPSGLSKISGWDFSPPIGQFFGTEVTANFHLKVI